MSNIKLKPWFYNFSLGTRDTINLSRVRSFHIATKERLASWNLIPSGTCETCKVGENISHILFDCADFIHTRSHYPALNITTPIEEILKREKQDEYIQIANFLEEINKNV